MDSAAFLLAASVHAGRPALPPLRAPSSLPAEGALEVPHAQATEAPSWGRPAAAAGAAAALFGLAGWHRQQRGVARRAARNATAVSDREAVPVAEESPAAKSDAFVWTRTWYPISPVSYLDESKPNPLKILGKSIVVWMDSERKWHAAEDACPHRMAPLSLGTVEGDGTLECRYHGWRFAGDGKCVKVPMATSKEEESRMCKLKRSAIEVFPVKVRQGLLFVFPDTSFEAAIEAETIEPYVSPESEGAEWVMTEAPVGYDVSVENTFDPSHASFLHHGINKYAPGRAEPMTRFSVRDGTISGKGGFTLEHGGYDKGTSGMEATRHFVPPCSNTTKYKYADGRETTTQLYFVPCDPRTTRYILNLGPAVNGKKRSKNRVASFFADALHAVFFNKLFGYRFQEQDLLAMRGQEQMIAADETGKSWGERYVVGTPSDAGVEAFRSWYYEHASGGPDWPLSLKQLPPPSPDSAVYDRWARHAKHCPKCRRALRGLGRCETFFARAGVASLAVGATAALLGRPCGAAAGACFGLLARVLQQRLASERWGFISSVPQRGSPDVGVYKQ